MDLFTYSAGDTRREALAAIKPHLGGMQKRVLDFIKENRGATDEEIRTALGRIDIHRSQIIAATR